jgi:SOS-response transcriptional repressor LexA
VKGLTAKQAAVHAWLCDRARQGKLPPTLREIGRRLGIKSTNGVDFYLHALAKKGYIRRAEMKSRGITILLDEDGDEWQSGARVDRMPHVLTMVSTGFTLVAVPYQVRP